MDSRGLRFAISPCYSSELNPNFSLIGIVGAERALDRLEYLQHLEERITPIRRIRLTDKIRKLKS